MGEINALVELQKNISAARARGECFLRVFWQFAVLFGALGSIWLFLHQMTHSIVGIDRSVFLLIGGLGLLVITILVGGDTVFFNRIYDQEHELERRQSALAADILGVAPEDVSLRYSNFKQYFTLTVTRNLTPLKTRELVRTTKSTSVSFHVMTASFEEALKLLRQHRDHLLI